MRSRASISVGSEPVKPVADVAGLCDERARQANVFIIHPPKLVHRHSAGSETVPIRVAFGTVGKKKCVSYSLSAFRRAAAKVGASHSETPRLYTHFNALHNAPWPFVTLTSEKNRGNH